ncbi:MAG: hypothetical protein MJ252_27990 [archaeon]|nr:hypothetical protein [archaeon]
MSNQQQSNFIEGTGGIRLRPKRTNAQMLDSIGQIPNNPQDGRDQINSDDFKKPQTKQSKKSKRSQRLSKKTNSIKSEESESEKESDKDIIKDIIQEAEGENDSSKKKKIIIPGQKDEENEGNKNQFGGGNRRVFDPSQGFMTSGSNFNFNSNFPDNLKDIFNQQPQPNDFNLLPQPMDDDMDQSNSMHSEERTEEMKRTISEIKKNLRSFENNLLNVSYPKCMQGIVELSKNPKTDKAGKIKKGFFSVDIDVVKNQSMYIEKKYSKNTKYINAFTCFIDLIFQKSKEVEGYLTNTKNSFANLICYRYFQDTFLKFIYAVLDLLGNIMINPTGLILVKDQNDENLKEQCIKRTHLFLGNIINPLLEKAKQFNQDKEKKEKFKTMAKDIFKTEKYKTPVDVHFHYFKEDQEIVDLLANNKNLLDISFQNACEGKRLEETMKYDMNQIRNLKGKMYEQNIKLDAMEYNLKRKLNLGESVYSDTYDLISKFLECS